MQTFYKKQTAWLVQCYNSGHHVICEYIQLEATSASVAILVAEALSM
jgi:hypothetical protein